MVHTVLDQDTRAQYTASPAETNFSYPWKIFTDVDLKVYLTPNGQVPDPVFDILVLNVDYTVTGAGNPNGGEIVLVVPATAGDIITIELDIPEDRLVDYSVGGEFTGASINNQLDKITKLIQQNSGVNNNRQLTYKITDVLTTGDVVLPYLEINQFWMKNASGGLVAVTLEQNPDWSTLRTELLNDQSGTAGSKIVGHYSTVNSSTTVSNELEAIQTHVKKGSSYYAVTAGTPNAYTATIADFPGSYTTGITLELKIHQGNTGAATININGLGPIGLGRSSITPLLAGDLEADRKYIFVYDGVAFDQFKVNKANETLDGTVILATKSDVKAATNATLAVTPGYTVYHPGVAKAWANFYWTGAAVVINDSYNISSITRHAAGRYIVNFSNEFANTFYNVVGTGIATVIGTPEPSGMYFDVPVTINTTNCRVQMREWAGSLVDPDIFTSIMFFGKL